MLGEKDLILAIETGGTKIQLVVGEANGNVLFSRKIYIQQRSGFKGILDDVINAVPKIMDEARKQNGEIKQLGLGFGGTINSKNGTAFGSEQIDGWKNFPLKNYFEEKIGITTEVYNDTNAAAWGEYKCGAGIGTEIFFYTNIGSGVGGGIIINNELYDGQGFGAAEFGQTYIASPWQHEGLPGEKVENLCSGWAIQNTLRKADIPQNSKLWTICGNNKASITTKMFGKAINEGDSYSLSMLDIIAETFSIGLANVINILSPQCVAIGGGVSLIGEPLISRINLFTTRYVHINNTGRYKIVQSELGELAVPIGILLLVGKN